MAWPHGRGMLAFPVHHCLVVSGHSLQGGSSGQTLGLVDFDLVDPLSARVSSE